MMKQKAGLGKKVSSIFDGVALPNMVKPVDQAVPQAPPAPPAYRPADVFNPQRPMQTAPPMPPRPAATVAAPQAPQIPRMAPQQPAPARTSPQPMRHAGSSASAAVASDNSWQQSIYKMFFSGNGEADARNKKTLAMVGMLSVVLVVVVMWTGVFSGSPAGANNTSSMVSAAVASNESRIDWTTPEPYPANLRDPMQVGSVSRASGDAAFSGVGGFVVKSIVFSLDNPTAVINGQIVKVGKTVNGAMVTKINKDSVEFSANGKSWKQQVE